MEMGQPPAQLDGADVLFWAVSRGGGFYELGGEPPHIRVVAMAIAQYSDQKTVSLFGCDGNWNVVADMDWDSNEEAKEVAAQKAGGETLIWHPGQKTS